MSGFRTGGVLICVLSSRRRHTRCALVTGVQTLCSSDLAAFLQQLPDLDEEQYKALVATSGGHSHGGGETQPHEEPAGVPDDHSDMSMEGMPMDGSERSEEPPVGKECVSTCSSRWPTSH